MKEQMKQWVEKEWGTRCPDYEKDCPVCKAWDAFDTLFQFEEGDELMPYETKGQIRLPTRDVEVRRLCGGMLHLSEECTNCFTKEELIQVFVNRGYLEEVETEKEVLDKKVEEVLTKISECDTVQEATVLKALLHKDYHADADEIINDRINSGMK